MNSEPVIAWATPLIPDQKQLLERWCNGNILASLECRYYWTIDAGMTKNSPPRLLLRSRLGGLLSRPLECKTLHASHSRMHLCDHHVFAHGSTVLINPEHSKLFAECIFYALQDRTQTINSFCPSEKYFSYN